MTPSNNSEKPTLNFPSGSLDRYETIWSRPVSYKGASCIHNSNIKKLSFSKNRKLSDAMAPNNNFLSRKNEKNNIITIFDVGGAYFCYWELRTKIIIGRKKASRLPSLLLSS